MQNRAVQLVCAALALTAVPAAAGSGSWQAVREIVGQTSTATVAAGGNPIYIPPAGSYSGTVGILMDYGAGGAFVCSGSLVNRRSIVTAAHCVSDGGLGRPLTTTVFFNPGNLGDISVYAGGSGAIGVTVSSYNVHPDYTGEVLDQNDIAILGLATDAPSFAIPYTLSSLNDLSGMEHLVIGYGARSLSGGTNGTLQGFAAGSGRLRFAGNRFEARIGDADFNGQWESDLRSPGEVAEMDHIWMSDFDNGSAFRDQMCNVAAGYGLGGAKYCNRGIGAFEGIGAGGDSGGTYLVNGELAAVHSFALWYRADESANRFGQFKGAVPIYFHRNFIATNVPEPGTWAMLIAGFGLVGATARRRREASVAA